MKLQFHQIISGIMMTLVVLTGIPASADETSQAVNQNFVTILGAIEKPGVYEIHRGSIQYSELVKRAGGTKDSSRNVHIVRNQRPGLMVHVTPENDPLILSSDVVLVPETNPNPDRNQVCLLNLLSRPVTLLVKSDFASLEKLLPTLGQSPESVRVIHAGGSRKSREQLSENMITGTVLVFDPDSVNQETIPHLPDYYEDIPANLDTVKFTSRRLNGNEKLSTETGNPTLPMLPVPVSNDPSVGFVKTDGSIGFPPENAELLDLEKEEKLKSTLKSSAKVEKQPHEDLPLLQSPQLVKKEKTVEPDTNSAEDTVPPPPNEELISLLGSGPSTPVEGATANFDQFTQLKVSRTLILSVMIVSILLTAGLLGSMFFQGTPSKTRQEHSKPVVNPVVKPVRYQHVTKEVSQPVPAMKTALTDRFDLESLIQDELVIHEKKPEFPNLMNLYGTPAGPRMIRVEPKQEFKAPHYIRQVKDSESKEKVTADIGESTSGHRKNTKDKIDSQLEQASQIISEKRAETQSEGSRTPDRKKSVKLKKPGLEISIEQKLGMLDQVLSSVQKPNKDD